jgi:hypothetical protein
LSSVFEHEKTKSIRVIVDMSIVICFIYVAQRLS